MPNLLPKGLREFDYWLPRFRLGGHDGGYYSRPSTASSPPVPEEEDSALRAVGMLVQVVSFQGPSLGVCFGPGPPESVGPGMVLSGWQPLHRILAGFVALVHAGHQTWQWPWDISDEEVCLLVLEALAALPLDEDSRSVRYLRNEAVSALGGMSPLGLATVRTIIRYEAVQGASSQFVQLYVNKPLAGDI